MKPFRNPLLKRPYGLSTYDESTTPESHSKKRRISYEDQPAETNEILEPAFKVPSIASLPRKPLSTVQNPILTVGSGQTNEQSANNYYNVLWRKFTTKKHKTWDGDGTLHVTGGYAYLRDNSGREMGKATFDSPLLPGSALSIGGKEIEVDSVILKKDFLASPALPKTTGVSSSPVLKKETLPKSRTPQNSVINLKKVKHENEAEAIKLPSATVPKTLATQGKWKTPLLTRTLLPKTKNNVPTPRHDPHASQALVMKRLKVAPTDKQIVDVVVDPLLTQHLREHQREGVKFLYECVMGMRDFDGQGAILADEMGLGKTLQTITLLWTLLKQNPIHGDPPVIKKALIVCPVTLINNWRKEFRKWLGAERIGVFMADGMKTRLSDFTMGKSYSVMIVGYEKLRTVQEELKKGSGIDIVIADEGHRLKTAKNKSAQAIKSLNTHRRVILSGTPIQNDLSEFFTIVDFVNPDLLGSFKKFTKEFEVPIMRSRQPKASQSDIEKGEEMSKELVSLTSKFILRRTVDILSNHLPSKTEYVLLCRATTTQVSVYQHVLACPAFQAALSNPEASLQLITVLKKLCNSPSLLNPKVPADDSKTTSPVTSALLSSVPSHLLRNNAASTKLRALDQLLYVLRSTTDEKVVLVSNYTSTLDLLSGLLTSLSLSFLRLDGSTLASKRQELVDTFNQTPASTCFAFLLSAKAGGVGLNLIGASRLVLYDVDWNPATDLQAMARIHRDGQRKKCIIYRFIMAGGMDEKIWQRQITKSGLASNIMDQKGGMSSFTREELKDLFRLDQGPSCQTHQLLGCACDGRGLPIDHLPDATVWHHVDSDNEERDDDIPSNATLIPASKLDMAAQERKIKAAAKTARSRADVANMQSLMAYSHIDPHHFTSDALKCVIHDRVLRDVLTDEENRISFVFAKMVGGRVREGAKE